MDKRFGESRGELPLAAVDDRVARADDRVNCGPGRKVIHRIPTGLALAAALLVCASCSSPEAVNEDGHADQEFAALQERGEEAMGVDQYTSTHRFDMLVDGARIELQRDTEDPAGVETIRAHLQAIRDAFAAGDFSIPAFVHEMPVPGTEVLAARKDVIRYTYQDLPRGGELRITTTDPEALEALRAFVDFQRQDHRAGGADHHMMNHGSHGDSSHHDEMH